MNRVKDWLFKYRYLLMFSIGMAIMITRGAYSLKYPNVYAEDGIWLGDLLSNGFRWTIINARADYFPVIIISMIKISLGLSTIVFNGDLGTVPIFMSLISFSYFTLVAMLPAMTFGKRINWIAKIFIFFAILLIPLGNSDTEIIGRTLQCHFHIWIIVFCLLVYRYDNKDKKKFLITLIDLILIPLIVTFPSVLLIYGVYGLIEIYDIIRNNFFNKKNRNKEKIFTKRKLINMVQSEFKKYHIKSLLISFIIILVLSVILMIRMSTAEMNFGSGFNMSALIEVLIRTFAFNFIWPFYNSLNNVLAVIILIILLLGLIVAYFKIQKKNRGFYILSVLSFISIGLITITSRGSITYFFNGYSGSYPDRYFMLSNMASIIPLGIIISEGINHKKRVFNFLSIALIVYFIGTVIIGSKNIFTFDKNELPWITNTTLSEKIKESYEKDYRTEDGSKYIIKIDPEWEFYIPIDKIDASLRK